MYIYYKIILICRLPWKNTCNLSILQAELSHWVEVLLFSKISSYLAVLLHRAFNNKSIFLLIRRSLCPVIKLQNNTYLPSKANKSHSACYFKRKNKKWRIKSLGISGIIYYMKKWCPFKSVKYKFASFL